MLAAPAVQHHLPCPPARALPARSDVGFVDPADFYANVPTTKMLLNKMFVMHRLRDAAHAGAE